MIQRPPSIWRRIGLAALMTLTLAFLVLAAAGGNETGRIAGAGSTCVAPPMQYASTTHQGYLAADRVDVARRERRGIDWTADGSGVDYDPLGSVGGLVRLSDPKIGFAATEGPVSAAELEAEGLAQFPVFVGAVAAVTTLDLGGATLPLDAATLGAIFAGTIADWSDPAIAALNPGVAPPAGPIAVVHRSDGSGTTCTFTGCLTRGGARSAGQSPAPAWPTGVGASGSRGVIAALAATPGAIGYVEVGQARRARLAPVRPINGAGNAVEPTAATVRAAATGADWTGEGGFAAALARSADLRAWPMVATVFVVMPRDTPEGDRARILESFRFFDAEAARGADALGSVALPPAAVEACWADAFDLGA